jgi:hypothetical protein
MEDSDEFNDWCEEHKTIRHRIYRSLFQSGAMEPTMEFLSQLKLPVGALQALDEDAGIPFDTLKAWRAGLRLHPPVRPYSTPSTISKRALNPLQEDALVQQIQSEFLDPKKLRSPQLVQIMALQIHTE